MIFAAHKLYYEETLENPTIFFIVDRIELEEQLLREFNALDIKKPEVIDSIKSLKDVLRFDNYKGRRDIFITLIHKFRKNELSEVEKEMKRVSLTQETLMTRKNVICFIDEGHRTQYGILAAEMKNILKNAFFFAFTGTPLSKKDRNTYMEFSYPPEELYLDRYFIVDSINDGFTVKIVYKPRLEKEVHLKKEELETFLKLEQEEIPEDLKQIVDKKVRKRISKIKVFFENPERIEKIAKDIAEHFKENVDSKFKAMVVAGSRKACWLYFTELLKYLPEDYIEVVMTASETENKKYIRDYVNLIRDKYPGQDIRDKLKEIITRFKEEEKPKILIVTDMLLTGFDAPILQVMYLDKPLKEHRLLQAIARTNRPYRDLKEAGIIIDYVGILKEFKKAFEIYSKEDIKGAILDYESLEEEFEKILNEIFKIFKDVPKNFERETLLKAIEVITLSKKIEEEFVKKYRKLRKLYEILGSREIKLKYLEEYKWLSGVYTYYIKMVRRESEVTPYVKKYFEKTIKLIHETIEIEEIDKTLPVFEFGAEFLKKLEEKVKSKKEKAANILFTLQKLILVEKHKNPVYESLVDRVERLVKMWRQKKKDYERLSIEGEQIWKDMNKLFERRESLGMDNMEYAMLLYLEERMRKGGWGRKDEEGGMEKEGIVNEIKKLSDKIKKITFPGWVNQITIKKEVGREVRRFVRKLKAKYGFTMEEMEKIYEELFRRIVEYEG
jgi:type I restriction enzyme R subunit